MRVIIITLAVLPQPSVADTVIVAFELSIVPTVVVNCEAGVQLSLMLVAASAAASAAACVAYRGKTVPWIRTGGVVSLTVIVCAKLVLLPELSVAVQVRVIMLLHEEPGLLSAWM